MLIPGEDRQSLVRQIKLEFPRLQTSVTKLVRSGWDNVVLEVDNQLIFRFPRFKLAEKHLQREIRLLSILQSRNLPVPIPDYKYIAKPHKDHYSFAGYRKIPGIPLTSRGYHLRWTTNLAGDLAGFLQRLHSTRITRELLATVPTQEPKSRVAKYRRQARNIGYKYLDRKTRKLSESFFNQSLETFKAAQFEPVLVHGDLTDRNMLIDTHNGKLTGILDWADSYIMDPAIDFAGLFEVKRELGYATLSAYGGTSDDLLDRIEFYWRMLPYFEILYGSIMGITPLRQMGVKRLRLRLQAPRLARSG